MDSLNGVGYLVTRQLQKSNLLFNYMDTDTKILTVDEKVLILKQEEESAMNFRKRRHDDWNDNYTLYRDKVITNRLTQRQTINLPLMKYGISTIMKDIDELPMLYFECVDNDQQKEIYYNEYWNKTSEANKTTIKDIVNKKQALLYGRSFKKLNIENGKFTFEIIDPQDILVERHVDPSELDSARCIIQTGIYRTLSSIVGNENYIKTARDELKSYFSSTVATQETERNYNTFVNKEQRLQNMGLIDALDPVVGETYIELHEAYRKEYDATTNTEEIILYVLGVTDSGMVKLYEKPLDQVIGKTKDDFWKDHFPYTSLTADPERTDFWNDGAGDIIRQPNKVLNSWVSQLVENRTLKNLNMHYYDSSNPEFIPQTYSPETWGWYPTPGNPNDVIKDVTVADLSESLDELTFIIGIAEKSIAASGTNNGSIEERNVTLGEVKMAITNAQERTKSMNTFILDEWKEFGVKYTKMLEAGSDNLDPVTINKKGREGKRIYTKTLTPAMYLSKKGYLVDVKMKEDKLSEDANALQKINATISVMPQNVPLIEIYKKRLLEFAGLTTAETKEVLDYEKQANTMQPNMLNGTTMNGQPTPQGQPVPAEAGLPTVPDIMPANNLQGA